MTAPRILLHTDQPDNVLDQCKSICPDAAIAVASDYASLPAILTSHRPDIVYSVRFAGSAGFPAAALLGAHGPQWLAVGGSGVDHLGVWDPQRLTVTNGAGIAADMMAEYVLGAMLGFALDVKGLERDRLARHWQPGRLVSTLSGASLLIVGLGATGRAVAARAKAFGMRITGLRANPEPSPDVDHVATPDTLARHISFADYIVVCAPLLPATKGMLDAGVLARTKPGAVLVDVSRGGIIVTDALMAELDSGRISGAALDVFETEPLPADHPLWSYDNVLISPHCSSVWAGWQDASDRVFCSNLSRWLKGEPLLNIVDPARGY